MHLVHSDKNGNLAVVSVPLAEGATDNLVIVKLWAQTPAKMGGQHKLQVEINDVGLLPNTRAYSRYHGSLRTPACSAGVRRLALKEPLFESWQPVEAFAKVIEWSMARCLIARK